MALPKVVKVIDLNQIKVTSCQLSFLVKSASNVKKLKFSNCYLDSEEGEKFDFGSDDFPSYRIKYLRFDFLHHHYKKMGLAIQQAISECTLKHSLKKIEFE